jgi:uncharacterized protein (DUF58 family)
VSKKIEIGKIEQYKSLEFLARQVVEGFITGLHRSPFHGFSVEFAEHRLYNPGESTRFIDWKLFGRTNKMFVKRFEEETNLRCRIIIDNSSSMYFPQREDPSIENPNKISFSVYAAAVLINLMKKQRDAVGLTTFSDEIEEHTQVKSSSVHQKFLYSQMEKMLWSAEPNRNRLTDVSKSLHLIAEMIHKRSLVIIFSDMMDNISNIEEVFSSLQHFKHYNHELIFFHVYDKKLEEDLNMDNRPHKFIDLETKEQIKLNPLDVREKFIEKSSKLREEIKIKCGKYGIEYVDADINKGFESILLPYLFKRSKLF